MRLESGQVAVVTGAASGLGLGLAHSFAERGMSVVLTDVTAGPLKEAVATMEAKGFPVLGVRTDVQFQDQVDALAAATLDRFGRVDVVCNNAGVFTLSGPVWEAPLEDWDRMLRVNLLGVVHGIRAFVPHLVSQNSGQVVNTASGAGLGTSPGLAPYVASKHAVVALSHTLQDELATAAPNVGVTVVCPGPMATGMMSGWDASRALGDVMQPGDAAEIVLTAIEANKTHALPSLQSLGVRNWVERILVDLPD